MAFGVFYFQGKSEISSTSIQSQQQQLRRGDARRKFLAYGSHTMDSRACIRNGATALHVCMWKNATKVSTYHYGTILHFPVHIRSPVPYTSWHFVNQFFKSSNKSNHTRETLNAQ